MISIILDGKAEDDLPFLLGAGVTASGYVVSQHNIQGRPRKAWRSVASMTNLRSIKFETLIKPAWPSSNSVMVPGMVSTYRRITPDQTFMNYLMKVIAKMNSACSNHYKRRGLNKVQRNRKIILQKFAKGGHPLIVIDDHNIITAAELAMNLIKSYKH